MLLCFSGGIIILGPETSNKKRDNENEDNPQDPPLNDNPPLGDETASLPLMHQNIHAIVLADMAATFLKAKAPVTIQPLQSAENGEWLVSHV